VEGVCLRVTLTASNGLEVSLWSLGTDTGIWALYIDWVSALMKSAFDFVCYTNNDLQHCQMNVIIKLVRIGPLS